VYSYPELDVRPQVIVSRDGDEADRLAAIRAWELMVRDPSDDQRRFLDAYPGPSQWSNSSGEGYDPARWLEALAMELPGPAVVSVTALVDDDTRPGDTRDVTIGIVSLSPDVVGESMVVAGFDQAMVERRVAEQREEFVARRIGHDTLHTRYTVDRTPRVQQGPTNTCAIQPAPQAAEPVAVGA